MKATFRAGAYMTDRKEIKVASDVSVDDFDADIMETATAADGPTGKPFVFTVTGQLFDVRLSVIRGLPDSGTDVEYRTARGPALVRSRYVRR